MARMYPPELPDGDATRSERQVFAALRDGLTDEWEAFHSVSWMTRDHVKGAVDGEIDFVLCHPQRAIVALEVKGKGIECINGAWFRLEPSGGRVSIKDPFKQALDHRYALQRKIDDVAGWRGKNLLIVHGLAFPMITIHQLTLAPDAPAQILIDRHAINEPEVALERLIAYHRGSRDKRRAPGEEGATMLRNLLIPRVTIRVPLSELFLDEEEQIILLTNQQSLALRRLRRNPRMVVTGCAGSGKTILALEHARRLAADGKDVVFVCFNRNLRNDIRGRVQIPGLKFQTFHGLCVEMASKAGVKLPSYPNGAPALYFDEELPEALVSAIDELGAQWDALIVDEAQDLQTYWLDALRYGLRDERSAPVWLFMDDNQNVYDSQLEVPDDFVRYDLTVNCRNTQAIHKEVIKLYRGEVEPDALGPAGRDIELFHTDDTADTVAAVLERLCGEEEVLDQDVVVLSSHGFEHSSLPGRLRGRYALVKDRSGRGRILFSSIRGFKGLESPVVVLCELEDLEDETVDAQLYVGISRAKNHCVIVAPPAATA